MQAVDLAHSKPPVRHLWVLFGFLLFIYKHSCFLYRNKHDIKVFGQ